MGGVAGHEVHDGRTALITTDRVAIPGRHSGAATRDDETPASLHADDVEATVERVRQLAGRNVDLDQAAAASAGVIGHDREAIRARRRRLVARARRAGGRGTGGRVGEERRVGLGTTSAGRI